MAAEKMPKRKQHAMTGILRQRGFTLIEIIVGIIVSAIALTFITTVFFSNAGRSVEPILQIRAAEFGQALMDEILAKPFDELTPLGGFPACTPCSALAGNNGDADGENRSSFDDVDDYNAYCSGAVDLEDSQGNVISANPGDIFFGFTMQICVGYDNDYNGSIDAGSPENSPLAKLIIVDIFPASGAGLGGNAITFSAYRSNF